MKNILEAHNIKKFFNEKKLLDDISFSLDAGECLGVVGLSGCGKSTLARIISRLIPCTEGQIIFCEEDITHMSGKNLKSIYQNMQMIFQIPEDSFDPRKTLGWSIAEPLKNHNFKNIDERVKNLLVEVGLSAEYSTRYPSEVSGGECQRAAIARAISIEPKLLICDEATSALDVTVQAQVITLIKELCHEKNISCLFITHDLALLPSIADRVMVMHKGKIIEEGFTAEIINYPKSPFTKDLLATNFFTENVPPTTPP